MLNSSWIPYVSNPSNHVRQKQEAGIQFVSITYQLDDTKFLIPREHIKRNKKKRKKVITGKGASTGNVMGAPEPVRHLFVKRISKDTNDEDVFTMMEQNGFTVKELKCISHPQAQFKSYKLAVPRSEFNKLFDENLWPKGVYVRTYWSQKPGSK